MERQDSLRPEGLVVMDVPPGEIRSMLMRCTALITFFFHFDYSDVGSSRRNRIYEKPTSCHIKAIILLESEADSKLYEALKGKNTV